MFLYDAKYIILKIKKPNATEKTIKSWIHLYVNQHLYESMLVCKRRKIRNQSRPTGMSVDTIFGQPKIYGFPSK